MTRPSLLGLPSELVQHILAFLQPTDLAVIAQVCRRLYTESYEESYWHREISSYFQSPIPKPTTTNSFRELYIAHHPNWFLVRNRVWFGDSEPSGKLLVARYDELTGSINAYTVLAMKQTHSWTEIDIGHSGAILHTFDPEIALDLHRPVLKLNIDSPKADPPNEQLGNRKPTPQSIYGREILMDTATESGLYSSFMLCRALPQVAITESTMVWPPQRFPAVCRTRNASNDRFNSTGHKPTKLSEVSQSNFRLRKWVEYRRSNPSLLSFQSGNRSAATGAPSFFAPHSGSSNTGVTIRMPEDITTYATLPDWCFTPTPEKPWQGIWCGDYSGHGCEFVLIQQPDKGDERPLPRGMDWLQQWFSGRRRTSSVSSSSFASAMEDEETMPLESGVASEVASSEEISMISQSHPSKDEDRGSNATPSGRLEAIKLSGDVNVPRAEYTFIAPEIGDSGVVSIADEEPFKGARIVRSAGHIASRGFRDGE